MKLRRGFVEGLRDESPSESDDLLQIMLQWCTLKENKQYFFYQVSVADCGFVQRWSGSLSHIFSFMVWILLFRISIRSISFFLCIYCWRVVTHEQRYIHYPQYCTESKIAVAESAMPQLKWAYHSWLMMHCNLLYRTEQSLANENSYRPSICRLSVICNIRAP